MIQKCAFEGCEQNRVARSLCGGHYYHAVKGHTLKPLRVHRTADEIRARDSEGRKKCRSCQCWLPISKYQHFGASSDGFRHHCTPCLTLTSRASKYGVTKHFLLTLLKSQGYKCALCSEPLPEQGWHVDHDHACCQEDKSCGSCVRGLLHNKCNVLLGLADDRVELLRSPRSVLLRS